MHNPAGLSLQFQPTWKQLLTLFLVISLFWMQIPALLRSDFFSSSSMTFGDSVLRTKIGFNQVSRKNGSYSQKNNLSVNFSSSAQELGLVTVNENSANIRVVSLNYSDLELIVIEAREDFGELFVNYESRLGFSAFVPLRLSTGQKISLIRNDNFIQDHEIMTVSQNIFREAVSTIESKIFSNTPKVLILLC
ncbi:MAG: hypothetical protein A2826_03040 [Candidatus Doudnabacteria bacterium RIFCSPHIGHO2_01_FULL_43_23]|uniref:Uncharacterized protein n=1 Tax=Candidatus Doudnabacteria bacterium RIFCSPHIGHO2_01_FULL_43_23 TaxID=1817822 RepID=A0A1F5NVS3_9BACT|nr:MAG: hypothetical protein A2826_03040 [Candidatus Doudnabacteria bacterium RIFCSPHIGHO2_01_FULL_43_23]